MDKIRSVLRHESPERLRRLAKAYLKAALMKDHDDGEKERLFFRAEGALWIARIKEQRAEAPQHAAMPVQKPMPLPQNERLVNHAALRWLNLAKVVPDPYHLHFMTLAQWGLEIGAEGDWPEDLGEALVMQLEDLATWTSVDLMKWLFSCLDEGNPHEQEQALLHDLKTANSPPHAAELVLDKIWYTVLVSATAGRPSFEAISLLD